MKGLLLIHGFGGTRREVQAIYDVISENKKDYAIEMPVLKGHEATAKEIASTSCDDWIESADAAYRRLSQKCDDITVVGFSMGGLIAANLYRKYKFHRLITVNTPIYCFDFKKIFRNLIKDFKTFRAKYTGAITRLPIHSLLEFEKLLHRTKPMFCGIDCDALVIQVQDDDTVNVKSGEYIYNRLNGSKRIHRPKCGGHVVLCSEFASEITDEIGKFLDKD